MKVLAIFTCFNRKEKTKKCIDSLAHNDVDISFLIVDDNSTDGTREELNKFSNVIIVEGDGNLFYSGGMRKGIAFAKNYDLSQFEYILLLNDDVDFFEGAIDRLIEFLGDERMVAAGAVCDESGIQSYGGAVKTSKFRPSFRNVMSTKNHRIYCDTFCANCVLIPKDIFLSTPNIDARYHHAMGDFDYGFQIKRSGYMIAASDFFVGICNDNPKQGSWRDTRLSRKARLKKKESAKGLPFKEYFYYLNKNHGIFTAIVYSLVPYIRIMIRK